MLPGIRTGAVIATATLAVAGFGVAGGGGGGAGAPGAVAGGGVFCFFFFNSYKPPFKKARAPSTNPRRPPTPLGE